MSNVSVNSVRFNTAGWERGTASRDQIIWSKPGAELILHLIDQPAAMPADASRLDEIRQVMRQSARDNGGAIVESEVEKIAGYPCLKNILKFPMKPYGMSYIAMLTFPFKTCRFVIKIQAQETGVTGFRDTVIHQKLESEGVLKADDWSAWMHDPYDHAITEGIQYNLSEDEKFDSLFPDHPLSLIRNTIKAIESSIEFDQSFHALEPLTS